VGYMIFGVRGNSNTPNPQRAKNRQLDSPANRFHGRQSSAKTESANRFFAPQIVASPLLNGVRKSSPPGSRYGQDDNDWYDTLANGILAHSDRGPTAQCVADQVVDSLQFNRVGVWTFNFGQIVFDSGLLVAQLRDAPTVCDSRRLGLGLHDPGMRCTRTPFHSPRPWYIYAVRTELHHVRQHPLPDYLLQSRRSVVNGMAQGWCHLLHGQPPTCFQRTPS
jgi:hypothetical protein